MEKLIKLPFIERVKGFIEQEDSLIQVILGPRQVGKTTGVKILMDAWKKEGMKCFYATADGDILKSSDWIFEQWNLAKQEKSILIIDEIQKVENWANKIKFLWDQDRQMKLILLGSLSLQMGLKESLAGRFFLHKVYHWDLTESSSAYGLNLEDYLLFGGYPGSYRFIKDKKTWLSYINDSIIGPVIGKDILLVSRVKSPALFKQCFDIICSYPAQEISYTKLLGQLQEKGNTDLIRHYLDLFQEAFLIRQIFKYSSKKVLSRTSSPKLLPGCPALYTATLSADLGPEELGRSFELIIGNMLSRLPGETFYWRKGDFEVDFIYQFGKKVWAIEVKSGRKKKLSGLKKFTEEFPNAIPLIVTKENFSNILNQLN